MEEQKTMPVIFSGHGSPMIALEHNEITEGMDRIGRAVESRFGRPRAILMVSAHWYTHGTFVQSAPEPRQVYDMYGFPKELYEVKYPAKGDGELTRKVQSLLGSAVAVNDDWGIDHGAWTVLVHMFPKADIPVVQLSVDGDISYTEEFELGRKLAALRVDGYLILGSGNVVHNLREVEWENAGGSDATLRFNDYITEAVLQGDTEKVIGFASHPDAAYAVPTPDHYLPLLVCLGAAGADRAQVFNKICNLGSMAMTGYAWGMKG